MERIENHMVDDLWWARIEHPEEEEEGNLYFDYEDERDE